tara:strand:+ start:7671 stop:9131 length:1461 start_codon:yes stop_codon:yes gene_type:complete
MKLSEIKLIDEIQADCPENNQYEAIKSDIAKRGIQDPVKVNKHHQLLVGYTRYRIAFELGIDDIPHVVVNVDDDLGALREYAILDNLYRRHFSELQLVEQGMKLEEIYKGRQGGDRKSGDFQEGQSVPLEKGKTRDLVAEKISKETGRNMSGKKFDRLKKISTNAAPEVKEKLTEGEITQEAALSLSDVKLEVQQEIISKTKETKGIKSAVKKEKAKEKAKLNQPTPVQQSLPEIHSDIEIFCKDARDLSFIKDESVHLVITSPPYNVGIEYGEHDDEMPAITWTLMLRKVLKECARVMVLGARIAVVVPEVVGGATSEVPISLTVRQELSNFFYREEIIVWDKGTTGNRTSWGSFRLPTAPAIRDRTERIIVAQKEGKFEVPTEHILKDEKGSHTAFLQEGDVFTKLTQDLWAISPETNREHPTPFPVGIPENLIRLYGFPGCAVLDPFAGSGTTGVAAKKLGCKCFLIDIDEKYCNLMRRRLEL